jgi:hypothetical protein
MISLSRLSERSHGLSYGNRLSASFTLPGRWRGFLIRRDGFRETSRQRFLMGTMAVDTGNALMCQRALTSPVGQSVCGQVLRNGIAQRGRARMLPDWIHG